MNNSQCHVLITYDIVDDKKRNRFATFLNGYGYRVQKSCFECMVTRKQYKDLITQSREYFEKGTDSIHIYRLNDNCDITKYGKDLEMINTDMLYI